MFHGHGDAGDGMVVGPALQPGEDRHVDLVLDVVQHLEHQLARPHSVDLLVNNSES